MDLTEIQNLIKFVAKAGVDEVELETKEFKITIKSPASGKRRGTATEPETTIVQQMPMAQMHAVPQHQVAPAPLPEPTPAPAKPAEDDHSKYIEFLSPMIGTFYRSSSPEKPVFVNVGDQVKLGSVLCIIEAMKLFNEIESEVSGKIIKVLVDDASPVEYNQPLFLIDPS